MIKIFATQEEAVKCSDTIHEYLKTNRPKYNAVRWSDVNKADKTEEYAVKMPIEFYEKRWSVILDIKVAEIAIKEYDKYPVDWISINIIKK